jgi:hypothetical protein
MSGVYRLMDAAVCMDMTSIEKLFGGGMTAVVRPICIKNPECRGPMAYKKCTLFYVVFPALHRF